MSEVVTGVWVGLGFATACLVVGRLSARHLPRWFGLPVASVGVGLLIGASTLTLSLTAATVALLTLPLATLAHYFGVKWERRWESRQRAQVLLSVEFADAMDLQVGLRPLPSGLIKLTGSPMAEQLHTCPLCYQSFGVGDELVAMQPQGDEPSAGVPTHHFDLRDGRSIYFVHRACAEEHIPSAPWLPDEGSEDAESTDS